MIRMSTSVGALALGLVRKYSPATTAKTKTTIKTREAVLVIAGLFLLNKELIFKSDRFILFGQSGKSPSVTVAHGAGEDSSLMVPGLNPAKVDSWLKA